MSDPKTTAKVFLQMKMAIPVIGGAFLAAAGAYGLWGNSAALLVFGSLVSLSGSMENAARAATHQV